MTAFTDLTGKKFGNWQVFSRSKNNKVGITQWNCKCTCGEKRVILGKKLRRGSSRSCGCLKKSRDSKGSYNHELYQTRIDMIHRCTNSNHKSFPRYGGRGIKICERWLNSKNGLQNFISDMGERPKGTQLDRQNNNGNYEPNNCTWATPKQNGRNRNNNVLITYEEITQPISAWAESTGIRDDTLRNRLKNGWSVKKALTTPVRIKRRK